MELLVEGAVGGIGGLIGRTVAFPFDTLKVRLATSKGQGALSVIRKTLEEEGVSGFYRGLPFSSFEAMYQKCLYVLLYAVYKRLARALTGRSPGTLLSIVCGYLSDLTCVPFSMPIEAMVVRLQAAPVGASRMAIIRESLFTRDGLVAALKSGRAYIVLSLKPGLEFAILDKVKEILLRKRRLAGAIVNDDNLPASEAFALGAVARGLATLVVYPYARGKAMSQAQLAPSAAEALRLVLQSEGPLALYRGAGMELLRGMTQAAVMFASMERVRDAVRRALLPASA
eukprot:TRINITY_DN8752_c0_g4_i1.p1 TRINITY_DN8752_c0_g4~~TRINITY_DN8752_c0_g4_i1.p1  ORF type:complete len:285 (+),score=53.60 TRINITY_DN8752_c0_g4_i1:123-977(+)